MKTIELFREVENSYIENFAQKEDRGDHIVFWDEKLPDMYAFNCTLVKENVDRRSIENLVMCMLTEAELKGRGFLQLMFHPTIEITDDLKEHFVSMGFRTQTNLYMKLAGIELTNFRGNEDCVVTRATTEEEFEEGRRLDVETSIEAGTPSEFAWRKSLRKKEVFQETGKHLFSYLCYHQSVPVGKCELYIRDRYAKIEDFDVLEQHQRKGYGTAMLKKMILDAIGLGVDHIYLIADRDDTPREMYRKLGFEVIGEEVELFWCK